MAGHYAAMKHSGVVVVRLVSLVVGRRGRVRECAEVACGFSQPPTEADGMERSINQIGDAARESDHGGMSRADDGD